MLEFIPIDAFDDNYIWLFQTPDGAYAVDPGAAAPVLDWLEARQLPLAGILLTHHHGDHTGGVGALQAAFPQATVYGPAGIDGVRQVVADGDTLQLGELRFEVIATPGHTLDHLCYSSPGILFCGDTLFGAGCGRLFEGSAGQMYASLQRLARLAPDTRVYPAHEYTLANLRFALACDPANPALRQRLQHDGQQVAAGMPTLPSTLAQELATNPFLRCQTAAIHQACTRHAGRTPGSPLESFTILRKWKDSFR